jgi:hypothetical protein
LKKSDGALNFRIFQLCINGLSNRAIARLLGISEHCVRIRLVRLSQQSIDFHWQKTKDFRIKEEVCFDGLENFAASQYDVNNIQQAIGRDSLFIYDFNFASLNRKGRMSEWQRRKLAEIEHRDGRYNPKAIRIATKDILARLYSRKDPECSQLTLLSDEHFQYRRAIQRDLKSCKFEHVTISSKACRNFQNILFSVNHADLMIRQQVGAFSRETICFSKTAGAMCQKYALYLIYKNYMAPQFTKRHVRRHFAHTRSPAQNLKLCDRILEYSDIFKSRSIYDHCKKMPKDWKYFWNNRVPPKYHRNLKFNRSSTLAIH